MTSKEYQIFIAAFFSEKEKLSELILSEQDLFVTVDIPASEAHENEDSFKISVVQILQMNLDCWYNLRDKNRLESDYFIKPSEFYKKTQNCFDYLKNIFPKICSEDINYGVLFDTIYDKDESFDWFTPEERVEFINKGYREIDLDLIEAAIRRNEKKCTELLLNGANPTIDPDEEEEAGVVFSHLGVGCGYHFLEYTPYHKIYDGRLRISLDSTDTYNMISELFMAASSDKLYYLIKELWHH